MHHLGSGRYVHHRIPGGLIHEKDACGSAGSASLTRSVACEIYIFSQRSTASFQERGASRGPRKTWTSHQKRGYLNIFF